MRSDRVAPIRLFLIVGFWLAAQLSPARMGWGAEHALPATWLVRDTLDPRLSAGEKDPAAVAMLEELLWQPQTFAVQMLPPLQDENVRLAFPSPRPAGHPRQDQVILRWYAPRSPAAAAPGILILHSLHPDLILAGMLARGLAERGLHSFILEMPGFGERLPGPLWDLGTTALIYGPQTVADARRARDVVATAPGVVSGSPGLAGISLGGFPAAVAAAAAPEAFSGVFLLLSGGNATQVLGQGRHEAEALALAMQARGYDADALQRLLQRVEPLTLAHRMQANRTWLFSATGDQTIPADAAGQLAGRMNLAADHHHQVPGNHYTAVLHWPQWTARIAVLHRSIHSVQP